ncbi:MAG: extracellular solute-binding protein [Lachnospiraceae bacterium]|nr:extracellular solute-binding protein [Lachnospiraceae bacterium]
MKSKMVKKLIAASLATVMAVSMAGCGDDSTTTTTPSSSTPQSSEQAPSAGGADPEPTAEPEDVSPYPIIKDADGNTVDLGGIEVIIRDWWSSGEVAEPNNAFEEAQQEYREWIQETYNFTIKEQAISGWGSTPQDFVDYATSGGEEYYVFTLRQGGEFISAMNSGLMYDLSKLDCLDFTEEKWNKSGLHELATYPDGAIYAMRAIDPEPRRGLFFNKRLVEEAGYDPDDFYKWQANGEWTWEKFEEVCAKVQRDTDADGITDIYAMTQQGSEFYMAAVCSNNGHFINKIDGKFVNELDSQATLDALQWAMDLRAKYEMPQPEGSNWDFFLAEFKNGKGVFIADQVYRANQDFSVDNMEDEFGFLCFPMGPNATTYNSWYEDNPLVIPACYDDEKAWKIAFAYNLYTEPIAGFEDVENWKTGYYSQFRDTESVDNSISLIVNNGSVTHHTFVPGIDLGADILWNLGNAGEDGTVATPAQKAEELKNSWQAYIDDANN